MRLFKKMSGLSGTLSLCFPCLCVFVLRFTCGFRADTDDQASEAIDIKLLLVVTWRKIRPRTYFKWRPQNADKSRNSQVSGHNNGAKRSGRKKGGGSVVAALVHINEIATNSCGPSRVNHSHFWAEGSRHCSRPSKPASLVLFGETRVVRHHGCRFLHEGVHTYLPVDLGRRWGSYICIQGRTKLLFRKFGSKGAALFLACWGPVGWRGVN